MTPWLWRFILVFVCFQSPSCWAGYSRDPQWLDHEIQEAWGDYFPHLHWGIGWAQLWQESRLRTDARSPVGAVGVAQFMPKTWGDMQRLGVVPLGISRKDAHWSIKASAYYMRQQVNKWWPDGRTYGDRYDLGLSSYNGGLGNILKAQKKCGNPRPYREIIRCLPQVTGRHAAETIDYRAKIHGHFAKRFGFKLWD